MIGSRTVLTLLSLLCGRPAALSAPPAGQPECVSLNFEDSILNRHLCEKVGLGVCRNPAAVLSINSAVVRDALNRERCLQALFGVYAAIACQRSHPAAQFIYQPKGERVAVVYLCRDVCKDIWRACSPRAGAPFADMLADEESKSMCKSLALKQSAVQIRQAVDDRCIAKLVSLSEADIAEINWLLGGKVNWHFIKLKGYAVAIIALVLALAGALVYTKTGYANRRRRMFEKKLEETEHDSLLELNVNMY